jgi:hypothetical protein
MTTYVPAKKNTEYIFYISLVSQSTGQFQANPTLAAGDFKVSIDGGALANLATLPAVTPATSKAVKVTLSTSEMNGDNIVVIGSDAAGAEWDDVFINIQTAVRQIDDLAFPTTSGRSIDVTAGGEVGIDWANIGSPTTVVNLSGTTVKTATDVETDTANIQTRIPAALSGDGFMKADLLSINDELTNGNNATLKLKRLDIQNNADAAVYFNGSSAAGAGLVIDGLGNGGVGVALNGDAAAVYAFANDHGVIIQHGSTGTGDWNGLEFINDSVDGGVSINAQSGIIGSDSEDLSVTNITDKIWDEAIAGHLTGGTTGAALNGAGAAGDPWGTALPGAYAAGTAGKIIGDNINATISSRATQTSVDDLPTNAELATALGTADDAVLAQVALVKTETDKIASIKTKTDSLTFTTAGQVDANVQAVNDTELTGDGSGGNPWGPV